VIMGKEIYTLWGSPVISDTIHVRNMQEEGYPFTGKELTFHISYSADHKAAEKVILDTVKSNPLSLTKPDEPFVKVSSHASNSLDLILRVWVKSENYWDLRFDLLAEVKDAFDKEKIEIPYNQLDIHIDK